MATVSSTSTSSLLSSAYTSSTASATSSTSSTSSGSSTSSTSSSSSSDSSDIDWDALIEAAVQAKLSRADSIDLKVTSNEAKIAAYQSLQSLLSDIGTAAQALRAPSGVSARDDDAFLDRSAYLTAVGDVDASASLSVSVESGTEEGTYDLKILQLAKAHKVAGSAQSSNTTALGLSGTFTLGVDDGEAVSVTIDEDMTLAEIAEAVNADSDTSGVRATVLKVSSDSYRLVLSSVDTGKTIAATDGEGRVLASLGVIDDEGAFADELQEAQDAIVSLDGVQVSRDSNDIDDLIEGMTFRIYQTTPDDTSISVEVGADVSGVKTAIQSLVDAYNAFRDFAVSQQTLTSSGTASSDSVLFGDGTLRSANSSIYDALNKRIGSEAMALLGLSFDENNKLVLDETTLDDALLDDLDAVQSLLSFQMEASSSELMLLSRGKEAPADFTLAITTAADGTLTSAFVNGDSSLFTVSGTRIVGAEGSPYEGFTFVYVGSKNQSIDISFSTGIAELLYNATDALANTSDGTLQTLVDNLDSTNDDLTAKSDTIRSAAETYRTNLTNRYAQYQAAIATAESTQDYLTALLDQWNSSS
jgi:flagellar hook-associated protein 2